MKKIDFNKNWTCKCLTRDEEPYSVTLPHDAMRSEPRTEESLSEGNSGWYQGGDYEYTKHVFVPSEYSGKKVLIEFESVIIMQKFILMERKLHTDRTDTRIFM